MIISESIRVCCLWYRRSMVMVSSCGYRMSGTICISFLVVSTRFVWSRLGHFLLIVSSGICGPS